MFLKFLMMYFEHVRHSQNKLLKKKKKTENLVQVQELEVSLDVIF